MKPSLLQFFLLLVLLFVFQSCKKTPENQYELNTDKTQLTFLADVSVDSLVITSTERWKITKPMDAYWLHVSKDSGNAGTTSVYFRADPNSANAPRTTSIIINSLGQPVPAVTVAVSQSYDVEITGFEYRTAGGKPFDIFGRGFSTVAAENNVRINGANAVVLSASNTRLTVSTPYMAGSGKIIVSTGNQADTTDTDVIYEWLGEVTIIAGGTQGTADGQGTAARFSLPTGISFDHSNNIYLADYGNYLVRKITPAGMVTTLPGRIQWPVPGPYNGYSLPTATAVASDGAIIINEFDGHAITKYMAPSQVSLIAGGNQAGYVNGNGTAASFYHPTDIALDASGNIFVADKENYCIRKISPNGDVSTFAGGPGGYQDGQGINARFNRPFGIDIDHQGYLYVCDYFNNRIRKITPSGNVTTFAGTGLHGTRDGDALTVATIDQPLAICMAPNGILYIAQSDGKLRLVKPNGKVESIASFVLAGTTSAYTFNGIQGLAIDGNGILHATDLYNHRLVKMTYK